MPTIAEILASRGRILPHHTVTVRIVDPSNTQRVADVDAAFRFVSDQRALDTMDLAAAELAKLKTSPSPDRVVMEQAYQFLAVALRDPVDLTQPLFKTATELKTHLTGDEALRLRNEYQRFADTHAPLTLTPEKIAEVKADATAFFVGDLLKRHGYWTILRLLPFLATEAGVSLTPTT